MEGGCANDYVYVFGDPINTFDLQGTREQCRPILERIRRALFGDEGGEVGENGMKGVIARHAKQASKMSKDKGHKRAYDSEQKYLRRQIKAWDRNDCWDPPDGENITGVEMGDVALGREWAKTPYPWQSSFSFGPFRWVPIIS